MKRFLRYVFYREFYRQLRKLGRETGDDGEDPEPARDPAAAVPIEEGPIETDDRLKRVLQDMDPYDFEEFVADLWARMGWETEVSEAARDRGVDVIARKAMPYEQTTLIQAKRYGPNTTVGSPEIQQYASLEDQYGGIDKVAVVTTNEFTGQAKELADTLNVKLVNGDDLVYLLQHHEAVDLVAEYIDYVHVQDQVLEEQSTPPDRPGEEQTATEPATSAEERASADAAQTQAAVPMGVWGWVVGLATAGWVLSLALIDVLPELPWAVLFLGSWILLPVGIYLDSRSVPETVDWPQHRWAYLLTSLVWILAVVPGVVYLIQRKRAAR